MRSRKAIVGMRLLAALALAVLVGLVAPAQAWAAVSVSDPRVVADSSMTSGQVTTWDCVWLGSYPQTYVDDPATVSVLDAATGWDDEGDLDVGGVRYRRLQESDATNSLNSWDSWSWSSKKSSAGYCYFIWEPVKWRVLETNGNTALVVSDLALDDQRYNGTAEDVTWTDCTLRGWLSDVFWDDCLTNAQHDAVVKQTLINVDNIYFGTPGGAATSDHVYLLAESDVWNSAAAVRHGFQTDCDDCDLARRCEPSDYAHAMGANRFYGGGSTCRWWLRSPGEEACAASFIENVGDVCRYGCSVDCDFAVRPALTISLTSDQVSYAGTVSSNGDETVVQASIPYSSGNYDKHDLANAQVSTISVQSYTGDPVEPDFTVRMGLSTLLRKGKDYTVSYSDNVEVGTAKVTITGAGDYHGSISRKFMISTEANVLWAGKELDLGFDSASFTLDDDVPILGGDTFNLDFPVELPIQTVFEDGKVKVGINLPKPYLEGSGSTAKAWEWTTDRKSMKEEWEEYCRNCKTVKGLAQSKLDKSFFRKISDGKWQDANIPGISGKVKVYAAGYLEYAYGEKLSDAAKLEGSIVITVKGSATAQKQWVVWVIPVTGSIKVSAEGTATGMLAWDFANSSWSGDLQLAVAVGLEPYVGVGVGQWASVGVYGSAKTGVDLTILSRTEPLGLREWYLYGEAGGRAYFAKKAFTWTIISTADLRKGPLAKYTDSDGHLRLWSKTQASLITGSKGAGLKSQSVDAGEELLASAETLPTTDESLLLAAASDGQLVEGAYPGAEPAVLDVGDTRVLVYVGQDVSRPELDQTILYYRVYDEGTDTWGDPTPVLDDGTADCMPTVLVDGDKAYVAWLDSAEAFGSGDADSEAYMASFSVRAARWDADSGSFVDLGRPAGGDAPYAYLAALGAGETGLVATWAENTDGAAFGLSSTNSMRQATFDGTAWSEPVTLAEGLNAVTSLAARGEQAAWAVDEDNDLSTKGQLVFSTAGQLPAGDVAALSYAELPGIEGTVLAANLSGGLSYCDGTSWVEVLPEGTMGAGSRFCVDGSSVYYVQASEDASHVAVATYDGGEWGNALVTTDDGYVDSLSDPCGTVALTHTVATLVEDTGEWDTSSEVRVLPSKERSDVALEAADLVTSDLAPGATMPVTLYVTNEGTSRMSYAYWGAALDGGELASGTAEVDLMPGETGSFEVELALPEDLGAGALSFWASCDGDDDADDGAQEVKIVKPDLEVTAEFLEGVPGGEGAESASPVLVVTVTNLGTADADATTTVSDEAGTELLTETETIAAGASVTYTKEFGSDDATLPADGSEVVLIARAVTEAEEFYDSNNVDYATAHKRYLNAEGEPVEQSGTDTKASIEDAEITVANQTYTGKALKPKLTVTLGDKTLVAGTDYTLVYENNVKAGTGSVTVTGAGTYEGAKTVTFTIAKASSSISLAAQTKTYTGKTIAYSGKVTRTGSTGKVTYAYYSDAKCTKAVKAANVKNAGTYYVRATVAADANHQKATSKAVKLTITKAKNPIRVTGKSATVKYSAVKAKVQVLGVSRVVAYSKAQGTKTYKVTKWTTAKAKKYISVNAKTGRVTVKKGTPKGTYTFKLRVSAAGNANYKAGSKTVTVKIVVK